MALSRVILGFIGGLLSTARMLDTPSIVSSNLILIFHFFRKHSIRFYTIIPSIVKIQIILPSSHLRCIKKLGFVRLDLRIGIILIDPTLRSAVYNSSLRQVGLEVSYASTLSHRACLRQGLGIFIKMRLVVRSRTPWTSYISKYKNRHALGDTGNWYVSYRPGMSMTDCGLRAKGFLELDDYAIHEGLPES
jgi:hypothetical protein